MEVKSGCNTSSGKLVAVSKADGERSMFVRSSWLFFMPSIVSFCSSVISGIFISILISLLTKVKACVKLYVC
jgi:hypothetical protein